MAEAAATPSSATPAPDAPAPAAAAAPAAVVAAATPDPKAPLPADAPKPDAPALDDKGKPLAKEAEKPAAPAPALPEKYELKVPDGFQIDKEVDADFQSLAKELKLTSEQAQKVGDLGVKIQTNQRIALEKAQAEWAESSKTDKEFGGEKLNENLGAANKALDAFGTPEFKALLKESKLGNHPEVIRFLVRTGKAMSDDTVVVGRQGTGGAKPLEQRLYPNNS